MKLFRDDMSETEKQLYYQGAEDALRAFAIWRDGTQYVNTEMGRTVVEALTIVARDMEYDPGTGASTDATHSD